jgi:hypothetical protein
MGSLVMPLYRADTYDTTALVLTPIARRERLLQARSERHGPSNNDTALNGNICKPWMHNVSLSRWAVTTGNYRINQAQ